MIISASRRTDIPAFYFDWFCQRLREGHVDVVNRFNRKQVSRISLLPEAVDCIVFWTKNPQADCWGMRKLPFMSKDMGELMDITRKKMSPTSIGGGSEYHNRRERISPASLKGQDEALSIDKAGTMAL